MALICLSLLNSHHPAVEVPVSSGFDLLVLLNSHRRAIEVLLSSAFDLLSLN